MVDTAQPFLHWLQSWLSVDAGLVGLFLSAFLSATVLPGSSEVVLAALVTAHPGIAWPAFVVALVGNVSGAVITLWMGRAARQGLAHFQRLRWQLEPQAMQRLQRLGPPALFLSFVPLIGDAMVLAAGWLNLPLARCVLWMTLGKGARYLVVVLGVQGAMSLWG